MEIIGKLFNFIEMSKLIYINKAFSLLMAVMLLLNTSGLALDIHFCQGHLKRANLFGKAKTCLEVEACMKKCGMQMKSCHSAVSSCSPDGDHDNCCKNHSIQLDMDYDYSFVAVTETSNSPDQVIVFFNPNNPTSKTAFSQIIPYKNYKPPLLVSDIPVLFQSFLL